MRKKLNKIIKRAKAKRESIKDRLQHDENAWLAIEQALNEQISQMAGYILRLEKRVVSLEEVMKKQKRISRTHGK